MCILLLRLIGSLTGTRSREQIFPGDPKAWKAAIARNAELLKKDVPSVTVNIVHQLESNLARRPFNTDEIAMYQASALSVRDHLISKWTDTQTFYTQARVKRVYYFSLEFLLGRSFDNAMLNLGLKNQYTDATKQLGFAIEDLIDTERDAGLGNGGLGRLAACYLDSSATLNLPCWGYSLRYANGIFKQVIDSQGNQVEVPDPWLEQSNPWEIARLDEAIEIKFHGEANRGDTKGPGTWTGGLDVLAVPYDIPVPGYETETVK